jgi:hypothetical protein
MHGQEVLAHLHERGRPARRADQPKEQLLSRRLDCAGQTAEGLRRAIALEARGCGADRFGIGRELVRTRLRR